MLERLMNPNWIQCGLMNGWRCPRILPRTCLPIRLPDGHWIPWRCFPFLAAATQRVSLGTAVLNLPFRPALPTAKWLASVQDLSGGRVRFGIGTGWMAEEFRALGLDLEQRGAMTDEILSLIRR